MVSAELQYLLVSGSIPNGAARKKKYHSTIVSAPLASGYSSLPSAGVGLESLAEPLCAERDVGLLSGGVGSIPDGADPMMEWYC